MHCRVSHQQAREQRTERQDHDAEQDAELDDQPATGESGQRGRGRGHDGSWKKGRKCRSVEPGYESAAVCAFADDADVSRREYLGDQDALHVADSCVGPTTQKGQWSATSDRLSTSVCLSCFGRCW